MKSAQIKLKGEPSRSRSRSTARGARWTSCRRIPARLAAHSSPSAAETRTASSSRVVGWSTRAASLFKVTKPASEGSCAPTTTTTTSTSSTTTTTLTLPFIPPPGAAPLRYRDAVFAGVSTTSDVVYGSAPNISGQTITLRFDLYEPTGDTVTERPAIVWVHGGSFSSGDKTSPELVDEANTFAEKGYVNASINYRLEPGGCSAGAPTANCVTAIQEAQAGCTDRGAVPAHERGDLRHRPESHRDRRVQCRRDHGAQRGVPLQRGSDGGGRRRGVPLGCGSVRHDRSPATRRACCSTARRT